MQERKEPVTLFMNTLWFLDIDLMVQRAALMFLFFLEIFLFQFNSGTISSPWSQKS